MSIFQIIHSISETNKREYKRITQIHVKSSCSYVHIITPLQNRLAPTVVEAISVNLDGSPVERAMGQVGNGSSHCDPFASLVLYLTFKIDLMNKNP